MDMKSEYRLRVKNCIGTIMDVHRSINPRNEYHGFMMRFDTLNRAVEHLDMTAVSEKEVLMVEQATNALLRELRGIFQAGVTGEWTDGPLDS
jgi:hypothetical protein